MSQNIIIPENEVDYSFSRSGGPGGQNVNKLNTRVEIRFNLESSPTLTDKQKKIIRKKLLSRINKDGYIILSSNRFRSQRANRNNVYQRLNQLIMKSLIRQKKRIATKIPDSVKKNRVQEKRRRGIVKKLRSGKINEVDYED